MRFYLVDHGWRGHVNRKASFLFLQCTLLFCKATAWLYALVKSKKRNPNVQRIAAVWYYPTNFNTGENRMAYWSRFLDQDGIELVNFHNTDQAEFVAEFEKGGWPSKYLFYQKMIWRRWRQFFQMPAFDVVWIDRSFLQFYPVKTAFYERILKRMGCWVVMDVTDGSDYVANKALVLDCVKTADTLTVGYEALYQQYTPMAQKAVRLNWTIPVDDYKVRQHWDFEGKPVVGWMGSPANYRYLEAILPQLEKAATVVPFKFLVICRLDVQLSIPGIDIEYHPFNHDYHRLLSRFDIGIAPFTEKNFSTEGKIGMKHQEFMIMQVPQVCSDVAISEHVVDNEHALVVPDVEGWADALLRLFQDRALREKLGRNSRRLFDAHYHYPPWYPVLREALTDFSHAKV